MTGNLITRDLSPPRIPLKCLDMNVAKQLCGIGATDQRLEGLPKLFSTLEFRGRSGACCCVSFFSFCGRSAMIGIAWRFLRAIFKAVRIRSGANTEA